MSGELHVPGSPQDMSTREIVQWSISFVQTFTSAPTAGTVYAYDVTNGEPGIDASGTILATGGASASSGTIIAPLMYGSACIAGHKYKLVFLADQGAQRGEQQLIVEMRA